MPSVSTHPHTGERPPRLAGGTWIQGHLRELAADNLALFKRCSELHGIVRLRIYWYECHVITEPELAHSLLVTNAGAFKKTRALQVARPTFGNGLVTAEGETWRRQQRAVRGFFTPRASDSYAELIRGTVDRKLASWSRGGEVDLHEDMVDVSLELVCRALFGLDAGKFQPLIRDAAQAVQDWHQYCQALCLPYPHYMPSLANYRYRSRNRALNRAVYELIRDARSRTHEDLGVLSALLHGQHDDETPIADHEIRDQVVTLFLAGHDTTAATLAFSLYELAYRPELQARIAAELEAGGHSEVLESVLKETLRLYPAVHLVARTAIRDVTLGSYRVRRGEEVVLPLYVMHRSPKLFADPECFAPERWVTPAPPRLRHAHLPFSTGPRVCTGQALAMAELRSVVGAVVQRFRLEPLSPRSPRIHNRMTIGPAEASTRVTVRPI